MTCCIVFVVLYLTVNVSLQYVFGAGRIDSVDVHKSNVTDENGESDTFVVGATRLVSL